MERTAECHCGQLKVVAADEPERVLVCHCKACQRRTGAAFNVASFWPKGQVRIEGERKVYERPADSGFKIRFHFCPECGSNVFWELERRPESYAIAVGSFADPDFPAPTLAVWEESMHPWVELLGITERYSQTLPLTQPLTGGEAQG